MGKMLQDGMWLKLRFIHAYLILLGKRRKKCSHIVTEALKGGKGGPNRVSDFSYFNCLRKLDFICQLKLHYDDWHRRG